MLRHTLLLKQQNHCPVPPCLVVEGAVLLSYASQTASDVQLVFARVKLLWPVNVINVIWACKAQIKLQGFPPPAKVLQL